MLETLPFPPTARGSAVPSLGFPDASPSQNPLLTAGFMKLRAALPVVLLLFASSASAGDRDVAQLLLLQSVETRIATIGHRLSTSANDLCAPGAPLAGIKIHDASQYGRDSAPDLQAAFGAGPWPKVLALAQGGAAAQAGVQPNDSILAIDGAPIPPAPEGKGYARVANAFAMLDRALADGVARLSLQRQGKTFAIDVKADRGCAGRFELQIGGGVTAKADGDNVVIASRLVAFAPDDSELAAAMAHELAHNILRHRDRLNAAGVSRGILQNFGRSARLTRETEVEADRLSVHLLDRAGYPMAAALAFWDRFRKVASDLFVGTHPSNARRIEIIRAEIDRVQAARARGEKPRFVPGTGAP